MTPITVGRQLRDFTVAAIIALLIASGAFVAVSNRALVDHQLELASRGLDDIAAGRATLPNVRASLVGPAKPSKQHPFLRRRALGDGTPLVAGANPDAKLFYDAAARFDREQVERARQLAADPMTPPAEHEHAELLPDGTGRAVAVRQTDRGLAVAVTAPAEPTPYPFLVIVGVLGLGAAFAAAGALIGGRGARIGMFAGVAALAVPCALWQSPVGTTAILLVAAGVVMIQRAGFTDRLAGGVRVHRVAIGFLAPAALAMLVLVAAPFFIGLLLGFYDHHHGTWTFVGLHNFYKILSGNGAPLDSAKNFWFILGVTVLWTCANMILHVTIGVLLAMALSRTWLRGKGIYRMLFILPWAIPNYITALIWKGIFTGEYGAMNSLLHSAGLSSVSWFSSWATSFSANVITNTWLGFPFMMVVALGALESIPRELYEAASVDGASAWQRFRHITLPHLRPALGPAIALGSIWTFNMFNVIFLVSGGQPGDSTNILITDAYRWAFERGEHYGMAAAYATIIFGILLLWTVFGARIVRSKADAES